MKKTLQRARDILRRRGEFPATVERFIRGANGGFYKDAWGVIDAISIGKGGLIRFIQVFSAVDGGGDFSKHLKKLEAAWPQVQAILQNPMATVEFWGWRGRQKTSRRGYFIVWRWRNGHEQPEKVRVYTDGREEVIRYERPVSSSFIRPGKHGGAEDGQPAPEAT